LIYFNTVHKNNFNSIDMSDSRHLQIGKRLKELRNQLDLSQGEMATVLKMTQSNLSTLESGRSSITVGVLELLATVFKVDTNWLLLGESNFGFSLEMVQNRGNLISENGNLISKKGAQMLSEAVCNAGGAVPSDLLNETSPIKVPGLPDGAVVIKVSGLSMAPTILDQDYIACMLVKERSAVRYGEIHLIITTQSMLYAKRLYAHEEGFQLTSDNRNYPVIHLKESEVAQIYDVVGRITPHITTAQEFDQEERMRRIEESFEALFLQSRKS
jgi:transcriptional regulator with XRE-family HTH domain